MMTISTGSTIYLRDAEGRITPYVIERVETPVPGRLSQRDPRWAGIQLFEDHRCTIGSDGCLITCMAMMLGRRDVGEWHDVLRAARWFVTNTAYVRLDLSQWGATLVGLSDLYDTSHFPDAWTARLLAHLRAGKPAILGVDFSPWPQDAQYGEHYVLATGIEGDTIQIADPWPVPDASEVANTLVPRYGATNTIALCRALLYELR